MLKTNEDHRYNLRETQLIKEFESPFVVKYFGSVQDPLTPEYVIKSKKAED